MFSVALIRHSVSTINPFPEVPALDTFGESRQPVVIIADEISMNVAELTSFLQIIATLVAAVMFGLDSNAGWRSPLYALPPLLLGAVLVPATSVFAYGVLLKTRSRSPVLQWLCVAVYSILPVLGIGVLVALFAILGHWMLPNPR